MVGLKMDSRRLLVVHDPLCIYSGLPVRYAIVGLDDNRPEWIPARGILHSRGLSSVDRLNLQVAEAQDIVAAVEKVKEKV